MKSGLYEFYNLVSEKSITISYCGPIVQAGVEGIALTLRKRLEADEIGFSATQSIFSIFIEQMQNMLNYSADRQTAVDERAHTEVEVTHGIFVLGSHENKYFINCGNLVCKSEIERLTSKIEYINSLNKDELKQYYRKKRREENEPTSKGAGLGFIEIARRSNYPMAYEFVEIDEEHSFFSLYVTVDV